MAPLRWVSPYLFRPPDPLILFFCLLLSAITNGWYSHLILSAVPAYLLAYSCRHTSKILRMDYFRVALILWGDALFDGVLDCLLESIDKIIATVTTPPRYPPPLQSRKRPPWRFSSLGFPASWLIFSAIMLPAHTVSCFQTEFHFRTIGPRCDRPKGPSYETLLNDNKWSRSAPTPWSGEPVIPARLLHLSGYGQEFASFCQHRIAENLAAARVNNLYSGETDDEPNNGSNCPSEVPSFRFSSHHSSEATSFHVSNYDKLDPAFVPALISERVCFKQVRDADIITVIFDTGCSFAMTHDISDFETPPLQWTGSVTTGSGTLAITGFGIVRWRVVTSDGSIDEIRVPCHLLPGSNQRLLSPQDYARYHGFPADNDQYGGTATHVWMTLASGKRIHANMDPRGNIPIILATQVREPSPVSNVHSSSPCPCSSSTSHADTHLLSDANQNLSQAQRALLLDHQRLGHLGFQHLQSLYRPHSSHQRSRTPSTTGTALDFLDTVDATPCCLSPAVATCSSCPLPKCEACLLATAKRRSRPHQTRVDHPSHESLLSTDDLLPGSAVSVDQYESSVRGRLLSTRGREAEHNRYSGGTIFVDHASGLVHVEHQVSLGAGDTLRAKTAFERMAQTSGVNIQHYHSDNGIFTSKEFIKELENRGQSQDLSGVGAHHQNGRAERAIQTIVWKARSMMIHQQLMWPEAFQANLWPMAMTYAAFIYNHTPRQDTGLAPIEIFTGTRINCQYLRRCRVWGSPTYVLDPKLQDGRKIPKWRPRARRGQFLGFSPRHSSTVALIRNLTTGSISPQYHIVVDEKFETVASTRDADLTDCLNELFRTSRDHYLDDHDPERDGPLPNLDDEWLEPEEINQRQQPRSRNNEPNPFVRHRPQPPQVQQPRPPAPNPQVQDQNDVEGDDRDDDPQDEDDDDGAFPMNDEVEEEDQLEEDDVMEPPPAPPPLRRSNRERRPNTRFQGDEWVNYLHWRHQPPSRDVAFFSTLDWDDPTSSDELEHYQSFLELTADEDDTINELLPMLFQAKVNDADSPSLREILNLPDGEERDEWIKAMYAELDQLQDKGTFVIVDRSEAGERQIVPSTWVFKRKRYPDGSIMKLKARFCVRGDKQWEVINGNEETHAPVVEWGTLRVILGLMLNYGMKSAQIDFRNAFVQSDLPRPIFLELPPGPFRENPELQGKILKVYKSLYGDRRAPRLWFQHLKSHLTSESFGFTTSTLDHCLFVKDGVAFVVYVDDAIIVSPDGDKIREVLDQLTLEGFDVKDEGNLTNYLGIKIQKLDDGSISMSQPGLIDRILETMDLTNAAPKETPVTAPLGKCTDAPGPSGTMNYRSVVGMLMYLVGNTRPDCSFATHQCARFSHSPKLPHEVALKRIGRYLLGTRDGGIILRPSPTVKLDCYVDADFAGIWGHEDADDKSSVRSRTGYYMLLGNVPVLWASKLQTEIALSTMEAEYFALSTAMRAFVPIKHVLKELVTTFNLPVDTESSISTVFEDNQPALTLATQDPPRLTPRSKHIAVKYHWFRSKIGGDIQLKYIPTDNQLADILTKPLPRIKFEKARKQLMGW